MSVSKKPEPAEDAAVPAVHAVAGDRERALVQRLAVVVELGEVEVVDRAPALAARAHAAGDREAAPLLHLLARLLDRDGARAADRGHVERERLGRADVRLPEAAEQDAQHRVGVGGGADRGARVGAHPLLVDDDRGGEPVEHVDLGPRQRGHEALHERAVGLVDHPLRLGGDGVEDQRALAGAGHAGEHREPALGQLDADVLEVVDARAGDADQVVGVGDVRRGGSGPSRWSSCSSCGSSADVRPRARSAHLEDADHVARGIAEGAVADAPRLVGGLLHDLGVGGLQPARRWRRGPGWPG